MKAMDPEETCVLSRGGRRKGNMILETTLVLVPLLALIFAIIDFGMVVFLKSTFQHAVREGVRYGVTYQTMQGMGHDASIKSVVQYNSMGFLAGDENLEKIKIRYYLPDTLVETPFNNPGNLLEVSVEGYRWGWIAALMRSGTPLMLNAYASDRMEGLPSGTSLPAR